MLYPLKLNAAFKDYLWGGTRLRDEFNKQTDIDPVAESWELSCHHDGQSIISNGEFSGKTLAQYIETVGKQVIGTKAPKDKDFPILIKLKNSHMKKIGREKEGTKKYYEKLFTEIMWKVDANEGFPKRKIIYDK